MKFTKMHGIGNDYVYVDCTREPLKNPEETARLVSDRHKGIGGDGLILIQPSKEADFEMAMYNADGSYGKMCGNGIRCVAKYVYDHGLTDKTDLRIISGGAQADNRKRQGIPGAGKYGRADFKAFSYSGERGRRTSCGGADCRGRPNL